MRTHLVLLFLGFMSVVKAQSSDRQAISDALQLQDYPRALSLLEQLPEGTESKRKMAYCHYQLGNWKAAKESYLTVLKDDSLDIQSHLYLGIIYDQEYDLPKAILHYRRLSTIDSTNTTYLKALAKTYEKAGLTADALKLYEKVHGMNDQDITALLNLATIWLDLKEFAIADSLSSLAFELDTNNLQVILTKARSQYSLKSYEEAVHFFERTRGHIDLNPFYQKMLGYAYLQID
ncbi:MAG: tetratricopeptide repeat protein, partial [Saprospiraceae bacterium]|nr:tetratricopeptide repeat protein [Saprospiraceae bacterium]